MPSFDPIDIVAALVGLLSLAGTVMVGAFQARSAKAVRRDDRISKLETALELSRDKHYASVERLMDEEESLRDGHAAKLNAEREKNDNLRVQVLGLRMQLLSLGVLPKHGLDDCPVPAHPSHTYRTAADIPSAVSAPPETVRIGAPGILCCV